MVGPPLAIMVIFLLSIFPLASKSITKLPRSTVGQKEHLLVLHPSYKHSPEFFGIQVISPWCAGAQQSCPRATALTLWETQEAASRGALQLAPQQQYLCL